MGLERFALEGKVATVTGSGRGIGKGIAWAFADAGADVVCCDLVTVNVEATAKDIREKGRRLLAIPVTLPMKTRFKS